tara:strand:- start:221 stop:1195 length:975 start_codon:yes stop_codon:yes gene_type:complete
MARLISMIAIAMICIFSVTPLLAVEGASWGRIKTQMTNPESVAKLTVSADRASGTCETCPWSAYFGNDLQIVAMMDFDGNAAGFADHENVESSIGSLQGMEWLAIDLLIMASEVEPYPESFHLRYQATNGEVVEYESTIFFPFNNLIHIRFNIIDYSEDSQAHHEIWNIGSPVVEKGIIQIWYEGPEPGRFVPIEFLGVPEPTDDSERRVIARWEQGSRRIPMTFNILDTYYNDLVDVGKITVLRNGEEIFPDIALRQNGGVYNGDQMITLYEGIDGQIELIINFQDGQVAEGDILEVTGRFVNLLPGRGIIISTIDEFWVLNE